MLHVDKATSPSDLIGTSEVCEGKKRGGGHETLFQRHNYRKRFQSFIHVYMIQYYILKPVYMHNIWIIKGGKILLCTLNKRVCWHTHSLFD